MDERKESSWNTTLLGVVAWIGRSIAYAGIVSALIYVGVAYQYLASQREQVRAHEQDQKTDKERIHAKNAAQNEKNVAQEERIAAQGARIAAQEERIAAQEERIAAQEAKNAAQDERLAELKETQVTILVVLEYKEKTLMRLEEQTEKALARLEERNGKALMRMKTKLRKLENKVDRMDDFLRGGKNSAGLDEDGSAATVSARLCM